MGWAVAAVIGGGGLSGRRKCGASWVKGWEEAGWKGAAWAAEESLVGLGEVDAGVGRAPPCSLLQAAAAGGRSGGLASWACSIAAPKPPAVMTWQQRQAGLCC